MSVNTILDKLDRIHAGIKHFNPEIHDPKEKEGLEKIRDELYIQLKHMNSSDYIDQQRTLQKFNIEQARVRQTFRIALAILLFFTTVILSGCWGIPYYNVWSSAKHGEAELKKAEWNRQITIQEAKAKYHSSIQLANAEIERAKGVAEANKIIGESLNNNESYLRYLWINNLEKNKNNQVIYVPADAGLPILEAARLNQNNKGK